MSDLRCVFLHEGGPLHGVQQGHDVDLTELDKSIGTKDGTVIVRWLVWEPGGRKEPYYVCHKTKYY